MDSSMAYLSFVHPLEINQNNTCHCLLVESTNDLSNIFLVQYEEI